MQESNKRFRTGEQVEIREVLNGKVWTIRPVTVIEDSDAQFVSYLSPGTLIDYPVGAQHGETTFRMWSSGEWELAKKEFQAPGMLRIAPNGDPFEIFAPVAPEGGISSWYVNFERPLQRQPYGFDTMDETLDLVVSRDFSVWTRRDEDELEIAVAMGIYRTDHAQRLLDRCATIEKLLECGVVPWDGSWINWTPASLTLP